MKTKELIALLQNADPAGELECCVDNIDIIDVAVEPAYFDGCLEVLIRDPNNEFYNVIGAKFIATGYKLNISPHSIRSAILDNVDLPIDYVGLNETSLAAYKKYVEERKISVEQMQIKSELEWFKKYVRSKVNICEEHLLQIEKFYYDKLSWRDKIPKDILSLRTKDEATYSYVEHRKMQWDRTIQISIENNKLVITKQ